MNKAVRKLNTDLSRMHKTLAAEKKLQTAEKTAAATEKNTLSKLQAQETKIVDQFISGSSTMSTSDMTKLLGQLVQIGTQEQQAKDAFSATMSKDKSALAKDKKEYAKERKVALKDLKPAEYHLSLKQTNADRKELGLKALKKAVRPASSGGTGAASIAKRYLGKYESQLQREGVTKPCPLGESCANFVTSMLQKAGAINFHTLAVSDLNTKLRARGWHVVSLKDAKPGDVWICNGAHGEQHTEIVASNNNGHVTLIGSNNHPDPNNQQINYDSYSASISGSFILAPPGK